MPTVPRGRDAPAAPADPQADRPAGPPPRGRAASSERPSRGSRRPKFRPAGSSCSSCSGWSSSSRCRSSRGPRSKVEFEPTAGNRPDEQPGTTYLLVGSDSRAGLSAEERRTSAPATPQGNRTDTIMLLHTGSGPNSLMSIPATSQVEIPGHGANKINAAFAFGGPKLLVRTIEEETGIRVDNYVEIGLGGVVEIVDAVGGVQICPKEAMQDKLANLDIEAGCQEADGKTALGTPARATPPTHGDIERAQHRARWSPRSARRRCRRGRSSTRCATGGSTWQHPDSFAFGEGTSPIRAALWASAMTRVNGENGLTCGVPIADLVVNWDEERSQQLFQHVIEDDTDGIPKSLCTPSGLPKSVTG